MAANQVFEKLLSSRSGHRIQVFGFCVVCELFERAAVLHDRSSELAVPARVTLPDESRQCALLDDARGDEQGTREGVDAADVSMEKIDRVDALAPELGVEIEPARIEPAGSEDDEQRADGFLDVVRKLIGVPSQLRITAVDVDASEEPGERGVRELVLERVTGECRVVHLDIELELTHQVVALEERVNGGSVEVVLVLR